MATKYAVGALWNDTNNWSASSGGAGGAGVPSSSDDVIFDANSISMAIDVNANAKSITTTSVSGDFAGTLTQNSTRTLTVASTGIAWSAGTLALGDSTFTCSGTLTVTGGTITGSSGAWSMASLVVSAGAVTGSSGTITVTGATLTLANGTYTHNSGKIVVNSASTKTASTGTNNLYDFEKAGVGQLNVTGTIFVTNDLTLGGAGDVATGTIDVAGNVTLSSTSTSAGSTATIKFTGSGTKSVLCSPEGAECKLNGAVVIDKSGGTITFGAATDTIRVSGGSWTQTSAASTTVITGKIYFNYTAIGNFTITPLTVAFQEIFISVTSYNFIVTGTMTVNGALNWVAGVGVSTGKIMLAGNYISTPTTNPTAMPSGTIEFTGSGTVECKGNTAGADRHVHAKVIINKSGGSLTIGDSTGTIRFTGDLTYTAGTVVCLGTSGFRGNYAIVLTDAIPSIPWNHIKLSLGAYTFTAGTMRIAGDLTIDSIGTLTATLLEVSGNVVSVDTGVAGTAAITLTGSGAQSINCGGYDLPNGAFVINKSAGTVTLASNLTLNGTGQDLTVTAGTFDLAGFNLSVTDVFTVANGAELKLKGTETVTATTKTMAAGSTVRYYDAAATAVISNLTTAFHNIIFGASKTHNFNASATYTVGGAMLSDGTSGTKSVLRSTVTSTKWNLTLSGSSGLYNKVDVRDSDASSGLQVPAIGSTDGTGNTNWLFSAGGAGGGCGLLRSAIIQGA